MLPLASVMLESISQTLQVFCMSGISSSPNTLVSITYTKKQLLVMEQQVHTFASIPYQHTMAYPSPYGPPKNAYEQLNSPTGHGSLNQRTCFQSDGRDPCSFAVPPCGSPLSTSSSISHAESVPTPPYHGMLMYDTLEPAFHHVRDTTASSLGIQLS